MTLTTIERVPAPKITTIASLEALAVRVQETNELLEVVELQAQADAFRIWVRAREGGQAMARQAAAIVLRAERRIGELTAKIPRSKGGNRPRPSKKAVLEGLGIDRRRACAAEQLAKVPAKKFERYVEASENPTTGGALVEFGARQRYHYASIAAWRQVALEAVAMLEGSLRGAPIERPAVLLLRRQCQAAQKSEATL